MADATQVRTFDARERYKVGEVISHAELGRGKVETVLRSSLLVRFPNGGLKSLMLT
jgi:RNase P/RNase MRP subunit POP5